MAIPRTRDFHNIEAYAWLRICRGLLQKTRTLDWQDEADRLKALALVERLIKRFEKMVYVD